MACDFLLIQGLGSAQQEVFCVSFYPQLTLPAKGHWGFYSSLLLFPCTDWELFLS